MGELLNNLPPELNLYAQWICWRLEDRGGVKPTKLPINPHTGHLASVTERNHWGTKEEATAAVSKWDCNGIGFVLTDDDPFTIIDLDDPTHEDKEREKRQIERHMEITRAFDSYTELSPSKKGLHIIIIGKVAAGRRRSAVEIYSTERYMTMTGDFIAPKREVKDYNILLQALWQNMGATSAAGPSHVVDQPETMNDEQVYTTARDAANGEKFTDLYTGMWEKYYPSQSEADFALIDIIAYYTQNMTQIERIFLRSILGQRDKARRKDYIQKMILRSFDRQFPLINIENFNNAYNLWFAQEKERERIAGDKTRIVQGFSDDVKLEVLEPAPYVPKAPTRYPPHLTALEKGNIELALSTWEPQPIEPPEGLMGDLARYIYWSSPRPVHEMAMVSAIGIMAAVCGRAWNISGTGLNLYMMLLAPTGVGKEAIASGINNVLRAASDNGCVAATEFKGPGEFSSSISLHRVLEQKPSCVCMVGEFGLKMQQISSPRASTAEQSLLRGLLDLFSKSGKNSMLDLAAYADAKNNAAAVMRPALSLIGESTPQTLFAAMDESMISNGLLPRFITIECKTPRPYLNEDHRHWKMAPELVSRFTDLCGKSLHHQKNDLVTEVLLDPQSASFFRTVDVVTTDTVNATDKDVLRNLWSRAHLKALKLAGLVAVGNNPDNPVVNMKLANWAYNVVVTDVANLTERFQSGEIGTNTDERRQQKGIVKVCLEYMGLPFDQVIRYKAPKLMHDHRVIPYTYINSRCQQHRLFRQDRFGPTAAIKRTIAQLLEIGDLQELSGNIIKNNYNTAGRAFMVSPDRILSLAELAKNDL